MSLSLAHDRRRTPGRALAGAISGAVVGVVLLAGCSGGDTSGAADQQTPDEVLATAADTLSRTSGVDLTLSTENLPKGVSGITRADGVATDAPAFEGTITVVYAGQSVDVPVVAVDKVVYAQLPFTTGYQDIDPGDYGAPDPAALVSDDTGFGSLLAVTEGVEEGDSVRGGADNTEVLTTYTGTVPGPAMKKVIPSSSGDSFDAEYLVSDDGELRQAVLTGVFYPDSAEMTYTVDLADYGTTRDIVAP
ncbi:LppX_LprAFG lipoprotein [Nocardioides sp. P5_C9_2]